MPNPNVATLAVKATGSSISRSLGDRLAQVTNVLDFGTDRAAIQAAINYAGGGGDNKGIIRFPPATYTLDNPVYIGNGGSTGSDNVNFIIEGCGQSSIISGNFSGPLLTKPNTTASGSSDVVQIIRDLKFINASTNSASGCLSFYGSMVKVHNCELTGMMGFDCSENCLSSISECVIRSPGDHVGCGTAIGGECNAYDLDVVGMDTAIRAHGVAGSIIGCRVETCGNIAIALGFLADGSTSSASSWLVSGNSLEGNGRGIYGRSLLACTLDSNIIHGEDGNGSFSGIYLDDNCSYTTVSNTSSYGDFGVTCVLTGSTSGGAVLTVTVVSGNTIAVGDTLNSGGTPQGTILNQLTGTAGGVGTYTLSATPASPLSGRLVTTSATSTNPSIYVGTGNSMNGVRLSNVDSHIATRGVAWSIADTSSVQLEGCNTTFESTFANKPAAPLDGDLRTFSNVHATDAVFGGTVGASGTGTAHMEARYSARTSSWRVMSAA